MNNFQASPTSIILDTETTGLREPQPIEIAFIQLASTGIVNTETKGIYLQRFKPTKAIEAGALKTHGITAASLVEMPEYKLSKVPFPADLKYIIAHNAAYDMKVLKCAGSGYSPKVDLPVVEICTLKLARKLWPELKEQKIGYSLSALITHFYPEVAVGLLSKGHSALGDCHLVKLLLEVMFREFEIETWEDLAALQN